MAERRYHEEKIICHLGTYGENKVHKKRGINEKLGNYAKEMFTLYQECA